MADKYTPTTDDMRQCYVDQNTEGEYGYWAAAEFDAWLAEHDAQVAAKALRDYADWLAAVGTELADCMDGADEDEAARWIAAIRSRADAMTRQADAPAADDEGGQE